MDRKMPLAEDFNPLSDVERLNENPGAAVVALLDSGISNWAIVTNGRMWRLYTAKAHSRATNYYEIDLEEIANDKVSDPLEAFRYFWFLFRAEAFRPSEEGEISLLDLILRESEQYAHKLGEKLKDRVFDSIFPQFAQGFIEYAMQRDELELKDLSEHDRVERLKEVFDGTLTFLYRLLFLLYAESRGLLPVYGTRNYYPYSLEAMKATIATKAGISEDQAASRTRNAYPDSASTVLYDRLQVLFKAVDKGDRTMNVPNYSGGLFMTAPAEDDGSTEAKVARFLQAHKIPDAFLALGLDLMARVEDDKEARLVFVDYKSLGVRQLGSIYEGLLEFKLHVALKDMTVVPTAKGKKTEKIIPWEEAKQKRISPIKVRRNGELIDKIYKPGEVYLINDRSERKATGSFYTPDYVVKYIIEHTVGEVLTQKLDALKKTFDAAQEQLKFEQNRVKALRQEHHITPTQEAEHQTYLHFKDTLNEQFFDLKVLDPAMGSGHFLVEAVDYITDRMTHFLEKTGWNPVVYHLGQMRAEIQQQMEEQGVEIDVDKLTEINLLKRQILKRCIYGVDINPMAVELAKVSVWLDSFTLGAPLSFLDHHLKCGNSLVGVRIKQVREAVEDMVKQQATLFEEVSLWASIALATEGALEVAHLSDVTAEQVHLSKEKHRDAEKALFPYKNLLNIYTSRWFSNPPSRDRKEQKWYDHVIYFLRSIAAKDWYQHPEKIDVLTPELRTIVNNAAHDVGMMRFFHWEMEFPEVFFGPAKDTTQVIELKDDAGFDAVVGNPPYRVQIKSQVGSDILEYYNDYYRASQYNPNLFALMIEKAISISKLQGVSSFIVPSLWLTNKYFSRLRYIMTHGCQILQLVDLGFGVFNEVVETSIFIVKKDEGDSQYTAQLATRNSLNEISNLSSVISSEEITSDAEDGFFYFSQKKEIDAILGDNVEPLAESFIVYRGVETRDNEKYLATTKLSAYYEPILMGTDINRYTCEWMGNFVKFVPKELKSNADISMYNVPEKLLLRRTGSQLLVGFDDQQLLAIKNLYVILPKKNLSARFLLALLNSKLLNQYNQFILDNMGDAFAQLKKSDIDKFPIHRINFVTSDEDRAYYREKAASLYEYCLGKDDEDYTCVLEFAQHHLSKDPEVSDVVHDLLAFLAEQMLELNKVKRAKQKEFFDALVKTLKVKKDKDGRVGIDTLVDKQLLKEYAGDYRKGEDKPLTSDKLVAILRKNRARLGVSLDSRMRVAENWMYEDEVRRLQKESLAEVLPIKERLRRTDELIDEVVYRLYGLTEEEIGIVEAKA